MKDKISVIVPIYNVEKYLNRCIDSIISQTYSNLEIILVDDGSFDSCPKICDEYAKKDQRIKVIHKQNAGQSNARNEGINAASGEYIGFVDSDDYILPDMYQKLYNEIIKNDADISICNFIKFTDNNVIYEESRQNKTVKNEILTRIEAIEKLFLPTCGCFVTPVNKLYKNEIFKEIRFLEGRIHEDEFSIHHIFGACKKIATIKDGLYMYYQRKDSTMGDKENIHHLDAGLAMIDRYYYLKENYPNLAKPQVVKIYAFAFKALKMSRCSKLPEEYKNMVKQALKILFFERNIRYFKLLLKMFFKF